MSDNSQVTENTKEIVVTEAMIEAGYLELREKHIGEDLRSVAEDVFRAMLTAHFYTG